MDYLKQNHLSILIIVFLVVSLFSGGAKFGAVWNLTTNTNPQLFSSTLNASSTLQVTGATTLYSSLTATNGAAALATTTINGLATYSPVVVSTTTTGGTAATLSEANLLNGQFYSVAISQAADFTYTLPASTTLTTFLANIGESTDICFYNSTTTAEMDLIFAAGTGIDLETATSTNLVESIGPADMGCIKFTRLPALNGGVGDVNARLIITDDSD